MRAVMEVGKGHDSGVNWDLPKFQVELQVEHGNFQFFFTP